MLKPPVPKQEVFCSNGAVQCEHMKGKIRHALLGLVVLVGVYGVYKPLPEGVHTQGVAYRVPQTSLRLFEDRTYVDASGVRQSEQQIFDEVLRMIAGAQHYIVLDMFLFNDFLGTATTSYRGLSSEVTNALVDKKRENPDIVIQVISDPINTLYGEYASPHFKTLEAAGVSVTITDLTALRDSNPLYSAFWRTLVRWFPETERYGFLPNLLDTHKSDVGLLAYLNSFNFKANHRKVLLADYVQDDRVGFSVLVTSANPHDGSSAHSNTAIRVTDGLWRDVIASERAVVEFSGNSFMEPPEALTSKIQDQQGDVSTQLITERAIKDAILAELALLEAGDALDMAVFYISDRDVVRALKDADERGAKLRLLLDANKDAFGREKNGSPNRQVAHELMNHTKGNTEIRWCNTHGEQCHSKLLLFTKGDTASLILGSANLTRRNLENLNLETNVLVKSTTPAYVMSEALQFFNSQWTNEAGREYSVAYDAYEDRSLFRTISYRIGEFTGMSRY